MSGLFDETELYIPAGDERFAELTEKAKELWELAKPLGAEGCSPNHDSIAQALHFALTAVANVASPELNGYYTPGIIAAAAGSLVAAYPPNLQPEVAIDAIKLFDQSMRECIERRRLVDQGGSTPN